MSRRHRSNTFSLFPFLAVLISTMGVLVVILLLVAQDANNQSSKKRDQTKQQLQAEVEQWQNKVNQLEGEKLIYQQTRDNLAKRLVDQRNRRSHLEVENKKLQEEAAKVGQRIQALQQTLKADGDFKLVNHEIAEQQKKINRLKEKLKELKDQTEDVGFGNADKRPIYSIVPIASVSGTNRRPIYIECSSKGIYLYPGKVALVPEDFLPPLQSGNPLDAALVAYREFWRANQSKGTPEQSSYGDAYPLIVLRPSGANWYGPVRKAMSSWADQFGYELVPEDWDLEYGQPEIGLKESVEQAVQVARSRSAKLRLAMTANKFKLQRQREIAARRNGSVSQAGESRTSRNGRSSAGGSRSPGSPRNWSDVGAEGDRIIAGSVDSRVVHPDGRKGRYLENANDPVALLSAGFHRSKGVQPVENSKQIGSTSVTGNLASSNSNTLPETSFPGRSSSVIGSSSRLNPLAQSNRQLGSASATGSPASFQPSSNSGVNSSSSSTSSGASSTAPFSSSGFGQASSAQNSSQRSGADASAQEGERKKSKEQSSVYAESIAQSRGKNWALPSKRKISSAYFRPIRIQVYPERMVLQQDAWDSKKVDIAMNGPIGRSSNPFSNAAGRDEVRKAMDPLIDHVWKRVDKWGSLGIGGYWKPVLKIQKMPGAEQQVEWFQSLLHNSGLEVEVVK